MQDRQLLLYQPNGSHGAVGSVREFGYFSRRYEKPLGGDSPVG